MLTYLLTCFFQRLNLYYHSTIIFHKFLKWMSMKNQDKGIENIVKKFVQFNTLYIKY